MNLVEFAKAFLEDKISYDSNGHNFKCDMEAECVLKSIVRNYDSLLREKEVNNADSLKEFIYSEFEKSLKMGDIIKRFSSPITVKCINCDENFVIVFIDEEHCKFVDRRKYVESTKENLPIYDLELEQCRMSEIINREYMEVNIQVPSGTMVLANFFTNPLCYDFDDTINKYEGNYSINGINGRNELMQHLAQKNIGYGQTSNTYLNVYKRKDGKQILIYDSYFKGEIDDNFEHIGDICCDVWRFQCADLSTLEQFENTLYHKDEREIYNIQTNVEKGVWNIKHHYDFMSDEELRTKPCTILTLVE